MSCSVALPNSPIFSLSSSSHYFTKNCSIISSSSEPLSTSSSSSHSSLILKKKRPAKLDIPVASLIVDLPPVVPSPSAAKKVVEVEGVGFSAYCKRGSRKHMEDRYSASLDLHGQSKQVTSKISMFDS
jgi:protein phosphatase 1L